MAYANPEERKEITRKWKLENPDKVREQKKRWRKRKGMIPRGTPRTHCRSGHEMTLENTYTVPGTGKIKCKACKDISNKRAFEKSYVHHPKILLNPEQRMRRNGWTVGMFNTTLAEQMNRCAICRLPMERSCGDHKHTEPPEPRGILCDGCNTAIGLLKENPETCRAAAEYLESWT